MKPQLSELSALYDDELEPHEVHPLVRAAVEQDEMREAWQVYALIGDQLRGDYRGTPDLTAGVMAKVREEPVVLAPRNLTRQSRQHPLLALAASVAGIAVVGWLALSDASQISMNDNRLAAVAPTPTFKAAASGGTVVNVPAGSTTPQPLRGDMSEYLLAHHTQASTFRLGDSTEHVRTVSMTLNSDRQ